MKMFVVAFLLATAVAQEDIPKRFTDCKTDVTCDIFDFTMSNLRENGTVNLSEYKGKVLLLINVATFSGYTYQYLELNTLVTDFDSEHFAVIGIPCNQFDRQEPGSAAEIFTGLEFIRPGNGFRPNFELTEKANVNGASTAPLYEYLKRACPDSPQQSFISKDRLHYDEFDASDIRWNFEKFLVGKDGKPIRRYWHGVSPIELHDDIEAAVNQ